MPKKISPNDPRRKKLHNILFISIVAILVFIVLGAIWEDAFGATDVAPTNVQIQEQTDGYLVTWEHPGGTTRGFDTIINNVNTKFKYRQPDDSRQVLVLPADFPTGACVAILALNGGGVPNIRSEEQCEVLPPDGGGEEPATAVVHFKGTAPTARENGDAITADEIANFKVYYRLEGAAEEQFTLLPPAPPGQEFTFDLELLTDRVWNLHGTTIDSEGLESAPSDSLAVDLTGEVEVPSPVAAPSGFTVIGITLKLQGDTQ